MMPLKRAARKLVFEVLLVLLLLSGFEIGLRALGRGLTFVQQGDNRILETDESALRILALGESTTADEVSEALNGA